MSTYAQWMQITPAGTVLVGSVEFGQTTSYRISSYQTDGTTKSEAIYHYQGSIPAAGFPSFDGKVSLDGSLITAQQIINPKINSKTPYVDWGSNNGIEYRNGSTVITGIRADTNSFEYQRYTDWLNAGNERVLRNVIQVKKFDANGNLDSSFGNQGSFLVNAIPDNGMGLYATDGVAYLSVGSRNERNDGAITQVFKISDSVSNIFTGNTYLQQPISTVQSILGGSSGYFVVGTGAGYISNSVSSADDVVVSKFNADNSRDATYGNRSSQWWRVDGTSYFDAESLNLYDSVQASVISGNDEIFILDRYGPSQDRLKLLKVKADGNLDVNFGFNGILDISQTSDGSAWTPNPLGLAIDSDGKILVGYYKSNWSSSTPEVEISRLNPDGSLDQSFSTDGKVQILLPGETSWASSGAKLISVDPSNNPIIALPREWGTQVLLINHDGSINERLYGTIKDDLIDESSDRSTEIFGFDGNDILKGGWGSDLLNGGTGSDTADFSDKSSALTITLSASNSTVTVDGETDTLISIENLTGGSGNDTFYGDDKANHLRGSKGKDFLKAGKGNDRVEGGDDDDLIIGGDGAGDDVYIGGAGEDTIKYTSATAGITVNLSTGTASATAGNDAAAIGVDQLSEIENVIAGDYADKVTGDGANNKITGGNGDDSIDGGAGTDTAIFAAARSAYKITKGTIAGSYSVTSSAEGSDVVTNIEYLQFLDKTYAISELTLDSSGSNSDNKLPTGTLSVRGKFSQGSTVSVSNSIADKDGIPKAGASGAIAYTWYADNVLIDGATASSFLLKQEHVGKKISVKASYTDLLGTAESVSSPASSAVLNVNDAPTGAVSIAGNPTQGQTLTASNTLGDLDGLGTISYQWKAGGKNIVGATSDTLTLAQTQVGQTISVTASYTDGFGKKESISSVLTSKVANINDLPTGQLTISGTAAEDQTLRAVTSSLADADGLGTFKYQWQSSSDGSTWTSIKGATAATYKLGDSVVGKYVRATVSYTDKLGTAESVLGESTGLVANVNDKPVGVPTITGKFIEGETLTANVSKITDADGLGTFSYLWQTSTDKKTWLDASTDATFQLSGTSAKQFVQLVVNFTDGNGTAESVKSVASAAIATKALTLLGTLSDDNLVGMSGNDTLYGNIGSDTLRGGAGNDIFLYRSVNDSLPQSFDYILDFSAGDKIDLKGIDANTAVAGDQAFAFKTEATKNAVWWNSNMLYGDMNGDAVTDFAIQVSLVGLSELKAINIIL